MKTAIYWLTPLLFMLLLVIISCASSGRIPKGLNNGRLAPCPKSPNCVSSEEKGKPSFVEPLAYQGDPNDARILLKRIIVDMGGKIEKESDLYLWAIFRTRIFRFVDDVEFRLDEEEQVFHVRSAARTGYSDFGVNRKRVEAIRLQYDEGESVLRGAG